MDKEIVIVGMGPGPVKYLTAEARDELLAAEEIYFRFSGHPVYAWLKAQGKPVFSFDYLYTRDDLSYERLYTTIDQALVKAAKTAGRAVYALPGNPGVFEKVPRWLKPIAEKEGLRLRVVAGLSFLELMYLELGIDPEEGLQVLNANGFAFYGDYPFTEKLGLVIGQLGLPGTNHPTDPSTNLEIVSRCLLKKFPADHPVTLFWSTGMPDYENRQRTFPLSELAAQTGFVSFLASLYVPPIQPPWETARELSGIKK